ncbi:MULTISPECIES: hypothetical protein [unclassified Flavobacterium]|uniref:hypothetical protein n=1 Tax=unclassified Flavobacterium TaxID=196869 RepID=UPI00095AE3DA|nr:MULTISPECIES: hypothetical protein [unclassified Flavobacterium]MBN9285733.1 hypothetical protein [Flavobacterium sp.]OJV70620.1 MAG: hypothetical protein BGO42_08580 [Flavobacterium sp. 40-81]
MKKLNLKKKIVSVLTDKEKAAIQGGGTNVTCASFATEIRWTEDPCVVPPPPTKRCPNDGITPPTSDPIFVP